MTTLVAPFYIHDPADQDADPLFSVGTDGLVSFKTVYNDYLVPGVSLRAGAAAPDLATFRSGVMAYAFNGAATMEEAHFAIHVLHDIAASSNPTFHVHWSHVEAATSGNVQWNLEYTMARGYGVEAFPATTTAQVTQSAAAQYVHLITNDDDIVVSAQPSLEPDTVILGRVWREPNTAADTFGADAYLLHLDFHYERKQLGTIERNRTFDSAGF